MRQIGASQEAASLGGIGACGRELCCSSWVTDFRSVSTSAARYQQLSINPQKLAGQCGKLKCCLNYELDGYMEGVKEFPSSNVKLKTKLGDCSFVKMDIFQRKMWYSYPSSANESIVELPLDYDNEVIEQNTKGVFPEKIYNDFGFYVKTIWDSKKQKYISEKDKDGKFIVKDRLGKVITSLSPSGAKKFLDRDFANLYLKKYESSILAT